MLADLKRKSAPAPNSTHTLHCPSRPLQAKAAQSANALWQDRKISGPSKAEFTSISG
jgi:hypothetical protein